MIHDGGPLIVLPGTGPGVRGKKRTERIGDARDRGGVGPFVKRLVSLPEMLRTMGFLLPISGGALVVLSQGESLALQALVNKTAPQTLVLKLFTNNVTPASGDTEATYTEMAGQGYASVSLTPASWSTSGAAPTVISFPQTTFTFTAGGPTNVYGYFVIQTTSGKAIWSERFAGAPFVIQNAGDQIVMTPQITAL
jgi:hypothetical protein